MELTTFCPILMAVIYVGPLGQLEDTVQVSTGKSISPVDTFLFYLFINLSWFSN